MGCQDHQILETSLAHFNLDPSSAHKDLHSKHTEFDPNANTTTQTLNAKSMQPYPWSSPQNKTDQTLMLSLNFLLVIIIIIYIYIYIFKSIYQNNFLFNFEALATSLSCSPIVSLGWSPNRISLVCVFVSCSNNVVLRIHLDSFPTKAIMANLILGLLTEFLWNQTKKIPSLIFSILFVKGLLARPNYILDQVCNFH